MYEWNEKSTSWYDGDCFNFKSERLNETYVNFISKSCINGSYLYFYGESEKALPDGESAMVLSESLSNGTTFYYYANGTVEQYDSYWWVPSYPQWSDDVCEYTKYETYTWAVCKNASSIQIMDQIDMGNFTNSSIIDPYIISYEYTNTYYSMVWSNGTVEKHDYTFYYGKETTDYSRPQPGYLAEDDPKEDYYYS